MNSFFGKLSKYFKKNTYAITVSFCMIFALTIVSALAISKMKFDLDTAFDDSTHVLSPGIDDEDLVPVISNPVVFVVPVANATFGHEYAKDGLVWFPTLSRFQFHPGIDFVAVAGTKVVAAYDGVIESVDYDELYGHIIVISHSDSLKTVYKSLSEDTTVEVGDTVKAGDQIGYVSNSARIEEDLGAHLHFEVLFNDDFVNPADYLPSTDK